MKKLTLTTEKVLAAYRTLSTAKYSKMEDADKIKAWKIARKLKPVATKFEEDSQDAAEKMKPSEDFDEQLRKAQEYDRITRQPDFDAQTLPMGVAEYNAFLETFQSYNRLVNDAVKDFADKEVELEIEPLTEDAFAKLMASNEWTMEQAVVLGDIVCE
jgi:hypothetical protein